MKICCAQITQTYDDSRNAFEKAEEFLRVVKADLVVFPEQYATGWRPKVSPTDGLKIRDQWIALARKTNTCIIGSYQKPMDDGIRNVMLVVSPEGEILAEYSKIHLFTPGGEDKAFSPGTEPVTFKYGGVRFGCAICFDLRFPELFREYLNLGVECVIIQAAWSAARVADWELLLRARALENRYYVVACGALGYDKEMQTECSGRSLVCDTEGRILEDAGIFEGELTWECDADTIRDDVKNMRKLWGLSLENI